MFLDRVRILVHAGDGGDGAATFRREAHVPRGGPDGGDGGRGGSIYLTVDPGETSLRDYRQAHHFKGKPGGRGLGADARQGRHDLTLKVPPGTSIFEDETGGLLGDLVAADQTLMVARGGKGGLGNVHFATSTHQVPRHAQKGEPGEERWIRLELRLIADIGLVGCPTPASRRCSRR
jgi:GTP-binding protein